MKYLILLVFLLGCQTTKEPSKPQWKPYRTDIATTVFDMLDEGLSKKERAQISFCFAGRLVKEAEQLECPLPGKDIPKTEYADQARICIMERKFVTDNISKPEAIFRAWEFLFGAYIECANGAPE